MTLGKRNLLAILSAAWLIAVTTGLLLLADYDSKPGMPASAPPHWPRGISLSRSPEKPTVLMFLHPLCPCSRASLFELARLAHFDRDRLHFVVLFMQPSSPETDWPQSELRESAVSNPDLHVVVDHGGFLAKQFGAKTSGQTMIYDQQGKLRFEGGITPGRGHTGDSFGRSAVKTLADGQTSRTLAKCATFGCALSSNSISEGSDRSR